MIVQLRRVPDDGELARDVGRAQPSGPGAAIACPGFCEKPGRNSAVHARSSAICLFCSATVAANSSHRTAHGFELFLQIATFLFELEGALVAAGPFSDGLLAMCLPLCSLRDEGPALVVRRFAVRSLFQAAVVLVEPVVHGFQAGEQLADEQVETFLADDAASVSRTGVQSTLKRAAGICVAATVAISS